jgi:hypothetical protein
MEQVIELEQTQEQKAFNDFNESYKKINEEMAILGIDFNVAHTCGVDYRWFPASYPTPKDSMFLPNQPPQNSENMILVDETNRTQYKGGKPLNQEHTWQQWGGEDANKISLSYPEQQILMYTKLAWQHFMELDKKSQDDIIEFKDAVHRLQQLIALRVARRVDTAVWLQPND